MDRHMNSIVHDLSSKSSGSRVADMTMDVMIPDEIKSELISDTAFDRRVANAEAFVLSKTEEEAMTVEQESDDDLIDIKVETILVEYATGKEACTVKTEPIDYVDMTTVREQVGNSRYESDETDSKLDKCIVRSRRSEVGLVTIAEEMDTAVKCESGIILPVKVKVEPGVGVKTTGKQSRTPASLIYPLKIESELDLSSDIIKDDAQTSAEETAAANSHLCADATIAAERWPESTDTENIPVDVSPDLVQRPACDEVKLIPVKIVSNTSGKKIMEHQGNSTIKRLCSPEFVQNVPGIITSIVGNQMNSSATTVLETPSKKTSTGESGTQPSLQNLRQVLSNMPAGMGSAPENRLKSRVKTLIPVQILPHLPTGTSNVCQVQTPTGLQGIVPVKVAQRMLPAETSMVNSQIELSARKVVPGQVFSNTLTGTAVHNTSGKRHASHHVVTNISGARNGDFQPQSMVQKLLQVKTTLDMTSGDTYSSGHMSNNEILKFPVKTEPELNLGTLTVDRSEENISLASKSTVKAVENFLKGKEYENYFEGPKSDPCENSIALSDTYNTKNRVVGELDTRFLRGAYVHAMKTLPSRVWSHSDTNIDDNSVKMNIKQGFHILPTPDTPQTESFHVVNEISGEDKLVRPSTEVSVMSPIDFGIKPKSFRRPRKEKLEVKKDIEFEIVPVNSLGEKNMKPQRSKSLDELEIPEMPPEVAAELTVIAKAMKTSNKTASELVREHGPRVKELWKVCSFALKKPGVKSKTNRRQEFKAWVMSAGEPGIYIMKTIAKSVADYTRKRREKIKRLAQAGDPVALELFSRVLENRRRFIERRRALREAGGPAAVEMARRARDRERERRARKAMMKSGNYCRGSV